MILGAAWDPEPLVLAGAAVSLYLFIGAFIRLRRRGRSDHASWARLGLFVLAVATGTLALVSPLDAAGSTSLSAHMLQHVLVGDVTPALALVALRGPLLVFFLPTGIVRRASRLRRLLGVALRPKISLGVWALLIAGWHIPAAYDYALSHQAVHALEHVSFVIGGMLAWTQLIDPSRRHALGRSQQLMCAVAMFAVALSLGCGLVFAAPLYPAYAHQGGHLLGLSPSHDQLLAGLVMIGEQLASLAVCTYFLLFAAEGARERERRIVRTRAQEGVLAIES